MALPDPAPLTQKFRETVEWANSLVEAKFQELCDVVDRQTRFFKKLAVQTDDLVKLVSTPDVPPPVTLAEMTETVREVTARLETLAAGLEAIEKQFKE